MAGAPDHAELIHDWNEERRAAPRRLALMDETLRDGLQSPSVRHPSLVDKLRLLRLMDRLGIDNADVGLPGASSSAREHIEVLARAMVGMRIRPSVACRTLAADIAPAVDIAQAVGAPLEVCVFVGSSPIRQYVEGWDIAHIVALTREAVAFCRRERLPCMFVTEDTTRARPEDLRVIYRAALDEGAARLCIADTVGHATPAGVGRLVSFVRQLIADFGADIGIDWHGHRDRGFGLINAIAAAEAGADRLHGTALGVGERVGNTEIDLLLVNLKLAGLIDNDLSALREYCELAARSIGIPLPFNYPVLGKDAFETATGVHAAAVVKALDRGDAWLANRVYSAVPADMVGLAQGIAVGPMSGRANVVYCLRRFGVTPTEEAVASVLAVAKRTSRLLSKQEILAAVGEDLTGRAAAEGVASLPPWAMERDLGWFRRLYDESPDGILVVQTAPGIILHANSAALRLYRCSADQLIGLSLGAIAAELPEAGAVSATPMLQTHRRRDGQGFVAELTSTTVRYGPLGGDLTIVSVRDVSQREDYQARLAYLTRHDPLTDLLNHAAFMDRLEHCLARSRRTGARNTLVVARLERFAEVGTDLGVEASESLLFEVARRIQAAVRDTDSIGRCALDTFALLLEGVGPSEIDAPLRRIVDGVQTEVQIGSHRLAPTLRCAAVTSTPDTEEKGQDLLRAAMVRAAPETEHGGPQPQN